MLGENTWLELFRSLGSGKVVPLRGKEFAFFCFVPVLGSESNILLVKRSINSRYFLSSSISGLAFTSLEAPSPFFWFISSCRLSNTARHSAKLSAFFGFDLFSLFTIVPLLASPKLATLLLSGTLNTGLSCLGVVEAAVCSLKGSFLSSWSTWW